MQGYLEASLRAYAARGVLPLLAAFALAGGFVLGSIGLFARVWPVLTPRSTAADDSDALRLWIAGGFLANHATSVVLNLLYLPLYVGQFASVERLRVNAQPFPWRSPHKELRDQFWSLLPRSIARVALNHLITLPVLFVLWRVVLPDAHREAIFARELPPLPTILAQLLFCTLVEDVLFYASHRALHTPLLYKEVHAVHHEFRTSITLAAEHAHVLEFLLGNIGPATAGALLLRSHALVLWLFVVIRVCVSVEEHGGYAFPWSPCRLLPVFGASVEGHDWHHANSGAGIFASQFAWLDVWLGTHLSREQGESKEAKKIE